MLRVVALGAVVVLWPLLVVGQESSPSQIFVEDFKVELKGLSKSDNEDLGRALAVDVQGVVVQNAAFMPMTFENLESQLRKEKRSELLQCSRADTQCLQKIIDNYGCDERLYGVVRQIGGDVQINLTRYRGDQLVPGGAATADAKPDAASVRSVVRQLAGRLFGLAGAGSARISFPPPVQGGENVQAYAPPADEDVVVKVQSQPAGAKVKARGVKVCETTPCSVEVPAGLTLFEFTLARHEPSQSQVEVKRGMSAVRVELQPSFARLAVTSEPSGVVVRLDGKEVGRTPLDLEPDPGRVRVEVGDAVYAMQWKELSLTKGQTAAERFVLTARQGGLKVKARDEQGQPLEGTVKVDGLDVGPTGRAFALNVGEHRVTVETPAGLSETTATVKEGETGELVVKVERAVSVQPLIAAASGPDVESYSAPCVRRGYTSIAATDAASKSTNPVESLPALSCRGVLLWKAEKVSKKPAVLGTFKAALEAYDRLSASQITDELTDFAAQAAFLTTEYKFDEYGAINLDSQSNYELKTRLKKKADLHQELEKTYGKILDYKSLLWSSACLFRIGLIYHDFARMLLHAPVPEILDEDQADEYRSTLEAFARPIEEKAIASLGVAVDSAIANKAYNEWSSLSARYKLEYDPKCANCTTILKMAGSR